MTDFHDHLSSLLLEIADIADQLHQVESGPKPGPEATVAEKTVYVARAARRYRTLTRALRDRLDQGLDLLAVAEA